MKIGMLSQPAVITAVAAGLDRHHQRRVVLDPVMVASSGDRLPVSYTHLTLPTIYSV